MWIRLRSIVLGASVVIATAGMTPPVTYVPPTFPIGNPAINDSQRTLAMMTIHAHARFTGDPALSSLFMPLGDAVNILRQDTGEAARSRRRRAVAKLSAYNFPVFKPIIGALAGSPSIVAEIETTLTAMGAMGVPPTPVAASLREKTVFNIAKLVGPTTCQIDAVSLKSDIFFPSPVSWEYEFMVPRRVADIARAFDPQSWDECSTVFLDTHLADAPGCCPQPTTTTTVTTATILSGLPGDPPACVTSVPASAPAIAAGRPYKEKALFEEFCAMQDESDCPDCANDRCDVFFQNVLCVDTWYDVPVWRSADIANASRYDVDYDISAFLYGELSGNDSGNEIMEDQGGLHVRKPTTAEMTGYTGTWSFAHVDKSLAFKRPAHDEIVGRTLVAIMATAKQDEVAGQIAEIACCDIMETEWGSSLLARIAERLRRALSWVWPIWPWRDRDVTIQPS
jgi:hypothetical protein